MLYLILLKFAENRSKAGEFMAAHNAWIQTNVDDERFLTFGFLTSKQGGCIIAVAKDRDEIDNIVGEDPFVVESVVVPEVIEVSVNGTGARLAGLF